MKKTDGGIVGSVIRYPFRYGLIAMCALIVAFAINFRKGDISTSLEEWGQFGDYFGGVLNPFFGLISVALVAATLKSQTRSAAKQKFEGQFFALLDLHASVLESIDRQMTNGGTKRGRDCFRLFYNKIVNISQQQNVPMSTAYQRFLDTDGWEIEHYFRTVYHMFMHVKEMSGGADASPDEIKRYYDLIKSQLSQYELVLLWLNVESMNRGNWQAILNESLADPFEHLNRANLIENPAPVTINELV
jgi:Putative phage abortive infection protein